MVEPVARNSQVRTPICGWRGFSRYRSPAHADIRMAQAGQFVAIDVDGRHQIVRSVCLRGQTRTRQSWQAWRTTSRSTSVPLSNRGTDSGAGPCRG